MNCEHRRTPADTGGRRLFGAVSALNWLNCQRLTQGRTPADTGFRKIPITNPRVRNFTESDVRRRPPSACGRAGLEHVGDILARLAAENPERWAWLLDSQTEQEEAA
jgi:hypothetical protein